MARRFFSYQPTTDGPIEDLEINIVRETNYPEWLISTADAVDVLNRALRQIAAEVDGRKTKDGWELGDGWKANRP